MGCDGAHYYSHCAGSATIRGGCPKWQSRGKITEDSFFLGIKYLIQQHAAKLPGLRRKYDKSQMEDAMSICAALTTLSHEVAELHSVTQQEVITCLLFLA